MAERTGPNRTDENRLKHACDAGFLSNALDLDDDDDDEDSNDPQSSDSDSCDSVGESTRMTDLSASFRVFSESLLRMERAEAEMVKAREALRCEAEKRRAESEAELTQMMLRTQLQIASFVAGQSQSPSPSRKRKRVEEDELQVSQREGALLLSLLQCSLIF